KADALPAELITLRLGVARILRMALHPGKHFLNFSQKKLHAFQRPSVAGCFFEAEAAAGPMTGLVSDHHTENNARLMH
ncbi:hypothetical protein, partial [Pseudomonas monteilii]|uniref:hypothetical protein n=1 Tax=Pseudomonas monteilii TaxID=76759 RepID=UPI001F198BAB